MECPDDCCRPALPAELPVMVLPDCHLFPGCLLPLYIFEARYRKMLADTLKTERMFSVALQKPGRSRETPCLVAGLGLIRVSVDHEDGTSHLILQGITRVELRETVQYKPYRIHNIRPLQPETTDSVVIDALLAKVHELVRNRIEIGPCVHHNVRRGEEVVRVIDQIIRAGICDQS